MIEELKNFGYGAEESVNYGIFGGISKALIAVLRLCHVVVRNWGLSIILLSVLLNLVLFPHSIIEILTKKDIIIAPLHFIIPALKADRPGQLH